MSSMQLVECPRDAMQGISPYIPAATKASYLNALLKVGFDTLDFGSFVSPKAVPQLADTAEVLGMLDLGETDTRLLAIVGNMRGARDAVSHPEIQFLGYPFSISETFQQRNLNRGIGESLEQVREMQELCLSNNKSLLIYISMAFGNPYGDPWDAGIAEQWVDKIQVLGVKIIAMADTVGTADAASITQLFNALIPRFPEVEFGAHFHAHPRDRRAKIEAAWMAGCRRFDSAINGFGGCPFAEDDLVGNIATEDLLAWCDDNQIETGLDRAAFDDAMMLATPIFSH